MTARLTGMVCLLASLPALGNGRLNELVNTVSQLRQVTEQADSGNPLLLGEGGQPAQPGGLGAGLMALLTGGESSLNVPKKAPPPPAPSTLIRYVPPQQPGETGRCETQKVPPGAKVIMIDGRVQIFRPQDKGDK
jgi:hypothetical protein